MSFRDFPRVLVVACAASVGAGCHASVGASGGAKAATNGEANADGSVSASGSADTAPTTAEIAARQPTFGAAQDERPVGDTLSVANSTPKAGANGVVLLGARHDLRLTQNAAATPTCACLAVALGAASDPRFDWLSGPPKTDPEVQLVIALDSSGVPCSGEPKNSLGASYWGYKWSGNDIVVIVEAAKRGRPITTGAVIPKPLGDGKVYVEPITRSLPYGRSLSKGGGRCLIGNPGPARTRPRSPDEVPSSAPVASPNDYSPSSDQTPRGYDTPLIETPE